MGRPLDSKPLNNSTFSGNWQLKLSRSDNNQLIDSNTQQWDLQALYPIFSPLTAAAILKIPLSQTPFKDKLTWEKENNCKFSICSAYHLIQTQKFLHKGESSLSNNNDKLWKKLWQLKNPKKVDIFASRAWKNGLPMLSNLQRKQVTVDSSCRFCYNHGEDLAHALFYCVNI